MSNLESVLLPSPIAARAAGVFSLVAILLMAQAGAIPAFADNPPTSINVDANTNRHSISPNIYGVNWAETQEIAALNAPLNRSGGNANSRYNWRLDAHSSGGDWYFETYPDSSGTPGASVDNFVSATRAAGNGAEPMLTIPMLDYLANLGPGRSTLAGFSIGKYGTQKAVDPWNSDAGNGVSLGTGGNITGNDPNDTGVRNSGDFQKAWVQHLVAKYGPASTGTGIKYYVLDNEYSAWRGTHRDVHPDPTTYDEIFDKIVTYATAVRAVDPTAKICMGEEYSWWAMYYSGLDQANGTGGSSSDYNTHGQLYFYPWLLQKIQAYKQQTGIQLINVLTVHGYTDGPNDDNQTATQAQRNRQTRILWDPNFQDPFWFGDIGIVGRNGRAVNWIPTMKAWVNQYCPGLQIGITEYNWGNEANLNGATTQADVLGIYGREGVELANRWGVAEDGNSTPAKYHVTFLASKIYRNYDGKNSTFGDTSVSATVENPDNLSAFAAVRASDGALTVMVINKQQGSTPVTVNLSNFSSGATAQPWQINSTGQTTIAQLADVAVKNQALAITVPAQSITLFVLPTNTVTPPPPSNNSPSGGSGGTISTGSASGGGGAFGPWFLCGLTLFCSVRLLLRWRMTHVSEIGSIESS